MSVTSCGSKSNGSSLSPRQERSSAATTEKVRSKDQPDKVLGSRLPTRKIFDLLGRKRIDINPERFQFEPGYFRINLFR